MIAPKIFLSACLFSALVPADIASEYQTPEYSGPAAHIEDRGMRGVPSPLSARNDGDIVRPDDTHVDARIEERSAKISAEGERRREEMRESLQKGNNPKVNE